MLSKHHLLLLPSFILTFIQLSSSSYINTSVLDSSLRCDELPYPFGTARTALPGFEIDCSEFRNPMLTISNNTYRIQAISLGGNITIFAGLIFRRCIGSNGTWIKSEGTGQLNLDGTPFTLSSQYNMLTVAGCNDLVTIRRLDTNLTSGCVTFCDPQGNLQSGSCSGLGCCQAALPGPLKSFELEFTQVDISTTGEDLLSCSTAFFAPRDVFEPSEGSQPGMGKFLFGDWDLEDPYPYNDGLIRLDWAIGNKSCEDSMNDTILFACKNNSYCYNSNSADGYLCSCKQGYDGNPYGEHGCKDIDECLDQDSNPCVGSCHNLPGTYKCPCPRGMTGDGKKEGSGCKRDFHFPLDVVLGAGLGLLFILTISSFLSYWGLQKRKVVRMRSQFFKQNGGYLLQQRLASQGMGSVTKIFTNKELELATENYNKNNILGEGGHGTVYKGSLSDLKVVAIKKSKIEGANQIEQFINEIIILTQINHRNVVKLLGCCLETQVPLLVYEFIPNGTLFHLIQSQSSGFHLPWECRLRIASEAAEALAYLHSAASFPIIHRDIKSSNILIDENLTAKVSDFGASRSVSFDKTHLTTLVQGTFGYLDPEYFQTSQLTEKSDVYSFGVVLSELLTGEKPISFARAEQFHNLAMYFTVSFDEGRLLQVIDPTIVGEATAEELYVLANLTRRCLNARGVERPAMKEVATELEALKRVRNSTKPNGDAQTMGLQKRIHNPSHYTTKFS